MSTLGAAPYMPERPSLWARLAAWHVGRSTVTPEDIAREVARMTEEERDALMPPFLRRVGAYVPPPAKVGPRCPLARIYE